MDNAYATEPAHILRPSDMIMAAVAGRSNPLRPCTVISVEEYGDNVAFMLQDDHGQFWDAVESRDQRIWFIPPTDELGSRNNG